MFCPIRSRLWFRCTSRAWGWTLVLLIASRAGGQQAEFHPVWTVPSSTLPPATAKGVRAISNDACQFVGRGKDDEVITVPGPSLDYWGHLVDFERRTVLVLSDGTTLAADLLQVDGPELLIGTHPRSFRRASLWFNAGIPRARVAAIIHSLPSNLPERDRLWSELARGERTEDEIWLDNGDRITGSLAGLESSPNDDPGAREGREGGRRYVWRTDSGDMRIPQDTVIAIGMRQSTRTAPDPLYVLGFRDGSQLFVESISTQADLVTLHTRHVVLTSSADTLWREVCYVRGTNRSVVYLSDLEPLGYKHIPWLSVTWPFARDASVVRGRLRTRSGIHEKGLGMHATSRLAYRVPADTHWLAAELAIDATSGERGSARCRVYGQRDDGQFVLAYESPLLRGGEPTVPFRVDVTGYATIALIVDAADGFDTLDRVNWLHARWLP